MVAARATAAGMAGAMVGRGGGNGGGQGGGHGQGAGQAHGRGHGSGQGGGVGPDTKTYDSMDEFMGEVGNGHAFGRGRHDAQHRRGEGPLP